MFRKIKSFRYTHPQFQKVNPIDGRLTLSGKFIKHKASVSPPRVLYTPVTAVAIIEYEPRFIKIKSSFVELVQVYKYHLYGALFAFCFLSIIAAFMTLGYWVLTS